MNNGLLYSLTILIWGSTWFAIKFQVGVVDPALSVAYRFALASAILFVYCLVVRRRLRFSLRVHAFMMLQGTLLFGINYLLFYQSTAHLTSGLVAVIFSTVVLMNMVNGAFFLGTRIRGRVLLGAGIGLLGMAMVFWPELDSFHLAEGGSLGLLLGIAATYSASLGNIVSARNQRHAIPIIQANAYGMAYGALLMLGCALASGAQPDFEASWPYVLSWLYLALFGSVVAFGCYLTLLGRIGADRAAYATLLFPMVALAISGIFEDYRWTAQAVLGMGFILLGNFLALQRRDRAREPRVARTPQAAAGCR